MASVLIVLMLAAGQIPLIPVPQEVTFEGKDVFRLSPTDPIVVSDARAGERDTAVALIRRASGFDLPVISADSQRREVRGIYLAEAGADQPPKRRIPGSIMNLMGGEREPDLPPQGYSLRVTKDRIEITGGDAAGTFYGVQTLCQLMGDHGEIPCVTIEDAPDLRWRGAWVGEALSPEDLDGFAALKCNLIAFESDDFLDLTPEKLGVWREVFEEARRRHIEPVPVIRTLKNVAPLLKRHPEAAVARLITEKIRLEDDNWALLSHPNVLVAPESPIIVSRGTKPFEQGRDYAIDRGELTYPYEESSAPWLIRRNIGGGIPDGAEVTVTYACVSPGTTDCAPRGEATEQAWLSALETISRGLQPRFIGARHDWPADAMSDPRVIAVNKPNAVLKSDSVLSLDKLARRAEPDVRLLVLSEMFQGPRSQLRELTARLPRTAAYVLEVADGGAPADVEGILEPWLAESIEVFGKAQPSIHSAYAWGGVVTDTENRLRGMLTPLETGTTPTEAFRIAMQKGWAANRWRSVWPEALNAYFDADLLDPEYGEVLSAVAAHVDRRTLGGIEPEETREAFLDYRNNRRDRLPEDEPQVTLVTALMANITEYLELERSFTRDPTSGVLRKLTDLVERQTSLDPRADEERRERIIETIERTGLFAPSSILFGVYVLPFREMSVVTGHRPIEIIAEPEYTDTEHTAQATYDFLAEPGPLCRIDFDTVGAATVTVESSGDGASFSPVQQWTSRERGGFRAPAILDRPVRTRYLRITVEAPAERAVLRNPRVFALKGPAVGVCGRTETPPVLDASFKEKCWPVEPQVDGFLLTDTRVFAIAQTTFWLCASRDTLYIAAYAREPRMPTMAAAETQESIHDGEHLEVTVQVPDGRCFTFAANPAGAKSASRAGNVDLEGAWEVVTHSYDEGWAAEFAIPFKTLGRLPKRSEAWPMNFVRFRNNVHKERSTWAYDPKTDRLSEWGNMIFD